MEESMPAKRILYYLIVFIISFSNASAVLAAANPGAGVQDAGAITNYTFTATSGTFTPLSGGTAVSSVVSDEGYSGALPIGFDFWYMGMRYTNVYAGANGWLSFISATGGNLTNNLATGALRPLVAPLWDDLEGSVTTGSSASYQTSGSAPNRVFTFEWLNWEWNYNANVAVISFQAKLYEGSGVVEFVYSQEAGVVLSGSASIGINATSTGSGNYLSLNGTGASPTASSTIETTTLNSKPATGQVYTFTPPAGAPAAPTGLIFTNVGVSVMTLNWTDVATDEVGYAIFRSLDGVNFTYITTTAASATSSVQGSLTINTLYYWQIYAVKEGTASLPLSGSMATSSTCTMTGSKSVGPTGTYTSLTTAIADINGQGLAGAVILELEPTYVSSVETFPLVIGNLPCSSATNTLTIRPQAGASGLSITSAATYTFDLNGAIYVTFDGQPGGAGGAMELTVANTVTTGSAFRYINDAHHNTLQYMKIQGVTTSASSGVVLFSGTTGAAGNDNNLITHSNLSDGATTPTNLIYSLGSSSGKENSDNTISYNNLFNFFNATTEHVGIYLGSYNMSWTITGNSIYETAARNITGSNIAWIAIASSSNTTSGLVITENYIGGTASNVGGSPMTLTGSGVLRAMRLTAGTTPINSVQGNVVQNISITSSSASTVHGGIQLVTGSFNVGSTSPNTIGSQSTTGSITFSCSGIGAIFSGMLAGSGTPGTIVITNNTIGGIAVSGTGTVSLRGISVQGTPTAYTISNNIIGSLTTGSSLSNGTNSSMLGIFMSTTTGTNSIANNTIANLAGTGATTSNSIVGIQSQGTIGASITGNTVRDLSSTSTNISSFAVVGITHISATTGGQVVSQNQIYSLSNNTGSEAVTIAGIYYSGSTVGANLVARNFIHNLYLSSSSASAAIIGLQINAGNTTYQNNMIQMGFDALGNALTVGYNLRGIYETAGTDNFYHNTVFIGGSDVTGATNTYAFYSSVTVNARNVIDNIFVNERSNGSGTGWHVAAFYSGTLPSAAGLSADSNVYLASGLGGALTQNAANYYVVLPAWRLASGLDGNSLAPINLAQVNLVNPTGNSSTVNLHVQSPTVIESAGFLLPAVIDDYDGQTRSAMTPVDIGADADVFTAIDIAPPSISYTPLLNTSYTTNPTLSGATVTDYSGVDITAGTRPRLYFKRSTDGNLWNDNTNLTDGWKYDEATGTGGSPFSFTIDYSLLNGGTGVTVGTVVQYFVVAQDLAPTPIVGINTGVFTATPTSVALTGAAFPIGGTLRSYTIQNGISGIVYVGTGQTYLSLTNSGGLFEAINNSIVTGNITAYITSDLTTEGGTILLNQWAEESGSGFTLTIMPQGGATRLVSGTNATGLINLNGADRVTFDGLNTGGDALTIRNINPSGATIRLLNDASNNVIQNCTIEGASTGTTNAVVFFSTGTTTGNDNNLFAMNTIRDRSDAAGVPANLVYSSGSSAMVTNSGNVISGNLLYNFTANGVYITSTGNESWTINGNDIYQLAARTTSLYGVQFNSLGANMINANLIHDLNTTGSVNGIYTLDARNTTISRNRLYNFPGGTGTLYGIYAGGSNGNPAYVTVVNNQVSIIPPGTTSQLIYAIRDYGYTGNTVTLYNNSVYVGGVASGSATSWACIRASSTPTFFTAINNIFINERTGGSVNHYAMGNESVGSGTWSSNYNLFVGTGTTAANFMDWGSSAVSFANWQTISAGDANSLAGTPAEISAAALFSNAAIGNLDVLVGTNFDNAPIVSNNGTPLGAVSTDFGGTDVRDATRPDIGADEFTVDRLDLAGPGALAPSGSQYGNYDTVSLASGVTNAGGNLNFHGNLTIGSGSTLNMGYYLATWDGTYTIQTDGVSIEQLAVGTTGPRTFNLAQATIDITIQGTLSNLSVTRTESNPPSAPFNIDTGRFWDIVPTGSGYTVNLTLLHSLPVEEPTLKVCRYTGSGSIWECARTSSTPTTITQDGITTLSLWAIGRTIESGISLNKTVGADAHTCAVTDSITVVSGSQVTYCYEVTNTGIISFTLHTLVDDQLGTLLLDAPYDLAPGASTFITATTTITENVTNSATWTATDGTSIVEATDTASVDTVSPSIVLVKTVGTDPNICAITDSIQVLAGTEVIYCYTVTNTGDIPLNIHDLYDNQLGDLLIDFNYILAPQASTFITATSVIDVDMTNTATWTANDGIYNVVAIDTATVDVIAPSIRLEKTVGADPSICAASDSIQVEAGTEVVYCYTVTNTGDVPLDVHELYDDQLGDLPVNPNYLLLPEASYTFTTTAVIDGDTTNTATWTASDDTFTVYTSDSAFVDVVAPSIELVKTVGTDPHTCALTDTLEVPAGSEVVYCYTVTNTGDIPLDAHDLYDDQLGTLPIDPDFVLEPEASYGFTTTAVINVDTTNLATWTASDGAFTVESTDTATVTVIIQPEAYFTYLPTVFRNYIFTR
jgi:hypothetical protein